MLHTIYYVDLSTSTLVHNPRRIGSGWGTHAGTIIDTHVSSLRKHSADVRILMLTDDKSPSFGLETFRLKPRPGEGIMDFRWRLVCSLGDEVPFTHADADVGFYGDIHLLAPKEGSHIATHKCAITYAPIANCPLSIHPIPAHAIHPNRKDYVNIRSLWPFDTAFIWVCSPIYLECLKDATAVVIEESPVEMASWWGDMAAHNLAIRNYCLRVHEYTDKYVGFGDQGQIVVLQKGEKSAETVTNFSHIVRDGIYENTRRHAPSSSWPIFNRT